MTNDFDWFMLLDRTIWLAVGFFIGGILGYAKGAKKEAHEAKLLVDKFMEDHGECPIFKLNEAKEQENSDG